MLKTVLESAKRYKAEYIDKTIVQKKSDALSFGAAIHLAILEPGEFRDRYRLEPDVRRNTNAYKDWKQETLWERPDAVLVDAEDMAHLQGMIDAVLAHPEASAMLRKGVAERSIYQRIAIDDIEGGRIEMDCKARPDYLHENGDLIDVKTTRDCGFNAFRRQIWEYRYDLSLAFYREIVDLEFGRKDRHCWMIALEKTPPYEVAVYRANDMVLDRGEADWRKALWKLNRCLKAGQWPGKQAAAQDIDLPGFVQYE